HAVSGSRGCTATAKPNFEGRIDDTSCHERAASVERNTPLWCCTHIVSGAAGHCTSRCTSWASGARLFSGGKYSAYMPSDAARQFAPPSSLVQTPPVDTPMVTWPALRGSTQIEATPD